MPINGTVAFAGPTRWPVVQFRFASAWGQAIGFEFSLEESSSGDTGGQWQGDFPGSP